MLTKRLLGKEVISSHGDKIGKMADLDIDVVSGRVNYATVTAGFNKKYKIKLDDVVTVGDKIIIRLDLDDLKKTVKKSK